MQHCRVRVLCRVMRDMRRRIWLGARSPVRVRSEGGPGVGGLLGVVTPSCSADYRTHEARRSNERATTPVEEDVIEPVQGSGDGWRGAHVAVRVVPGCRKIHPPPGPPHLAPTTPRYSRPGLVPLPPPAPSPRPTMPLHPTRHRTINAAVVLGGRGIDNPMLSLPWSAMGWQRLSGGGPSSSAERAARSFGPGTTLWGPNRHKEPNLDLRRTKAPPCRSRAAVWSRCNNSGSPQTVPRTC